MKKALILLIAVMYLGVTSGVMVNIHYCMGRIAKVNYGHENDDTCGKCGMAKNDLCCKTEHKLLKASGDHLLVKAFTSFNSQPAEIPTAYTVATENGYSDGSVTHLRYHSPPDKRSNEIYLHSGVFKI